MRDQTALTNVIETISAADRGGEIDRDLLAEALDGVRAMLKRDDRGWSPYIGANRGEHEEGLTLNDLKQWSKNIREGVVAAPWIKRGLALRSSYIWKDDIQYAGVDDEGAKANKGGSGRPSKDQKVARVGLEALENPVNISSFFSPPARRRREGLLYHDGLALWIGDDATKEIETIPLTEITEVFTDPDHDDIIWAYRREWTRRQVNGKYKPMKRWYFVDTYKNRTRPYITTAGEGGKVEREVVEQGFTAFDMHANRLEGWKFGSPDALAAWIWNQIARDLYMDGVAVSEAMQTFAFKVNSSTKKGAENGALAFGNPNGAGSAFVSGNGADITPLSSAGKGYDFSTIREVVSVIAAAIDVSNIHLTANPGDAGSSYGSAATLDLPTRLIMSERRNEHIELEQRVLAWLGLKGVKAYFLTYDDGAEIYRQMQSLTLQYQQGVISPEEYSARAYNILGIPVAPPVPKGVIIPSNTEFPESPMNDAPTNGGGTGSDADGSTGIQAAAPNQGRSSGTGKSGRSQDIRQ